VSNLSKSVVRDHNRTFIPTFNKQAFLEACGVKPFCYAR
jgi:hypothetical protein